ncbi:MAG: trypsin-like peptidase domain-containing protein [Betaproteobacteria bacterium]|nr:trypsin-like peptidase domain-containing protein [Betaproteobacteria bacterium]
MFVLKAGAVAVLAVWTVLGYARTPEQIYQQASKSVVVIQAFDREDNPINQGGGVVVGREAVVTNCHVVEDSAKLVVSYDKEQFDATLTHADHERDLCQLAVPRLTAPRAALWTGRLRVGQRVYAIGAPEGLELTFTEGLVSSLREFEGSQYIQTSAAISQGSSGGGLFDTEGRLIGITAFFLQDGQNLNFAAPASWIAQLAARAGGGTAKKPVSSTRDSVARRWAVRIGDAKAKKDWAGALTLAQQWVRAQPTHAAAWQELGDAYRSMNRPRRAVSPYMQALRLDPDMFEGWLNLGLSYLTLSQHDRAVEAFQEALRIRPHDSAALYNAGVAYHFQNRQDKVKEVYTTLSVRDPRAAQEFAGRYLKR